MINIISTNKIEYILENGIVLTPNNWIDNRYEVNGVKYYPVFSTNKRNQFELDVIGFENILFQAQKLSNTVEHKG